MPQDRAHVPFPPSAPTSGSDPGNAGNSTGAFAGGTYFLGRYRVVDEIGVGGMASVHLARMDGPGGLPEVGRHQAHPPAPRRGRDVRRTCSSTRRASPRASRTRTSRTVFELGEARGHLLDRDGVPPRRAAPRGDAPHRGAAGSRCRRRSRAASSPTPPRACTPRTSCSGKNGEKLGLVHRDVTPHNLFVTYDGSTKVVDFGIAKFSSRMAEHARRHAQGQARVHVARSR